MNEIDKQVMKILPEPPAPWRWRENLNPSITEKPDRWTLLNISLKDETEATSCRVFNVSVLGQSSEPRVLAMSCLMQVQTMMEGRRDLEREERNQLTAMIVDWLNQNIPERVANIRVGSKKQ